MSFPVSEARRALPVLGMKLSVRRRSTTSVAFAALALSLTLSTRALGTGVAPGYSLDDWNAVLETYVDEHGLVDYAALENDRQALDVFLAGVRRVSPDSHPELFPTRNDKLAYYINAYNAWVFFGVLELPPDAGTVWGKTKSGYGFFVRQKIVLGGERTNLRKLENSIIRARFEDPRIHAALNCASLGCPRLPRRAFEPERLDAQLDAAMTELVNDPRHCRLDTAAGTVSLSKIFDWFRKDFESFEASRGNTDDNALIHYVNRYRAADQQIPLGSEIRFLPYDKGLNRQPE